MAAVILTDSTGAKSMVARTQRDGTLASGVSLMTQGNSYRASASFTPFVTSALVVLRFAGSSAVVAKIKKFVIGGVSTASGASINQVQRVTAVGTGGTAVLPTIAKNSPRSPAASCTVTHYTTAAQSAGTASGGPLWTGNVITGITAAPTTSGFCPPQIVYPEGGLLAGDPWEINPTSLAGDAFEFGQTAATTLPTGTVYQYVIEWEEYVVGAE